MKETQWEYITANWGESDPLVMEEIAKMKDADCIEQQNAAAAIEERDKKIQELTQQNIELNKTNMNLILRLTDPAIAPPKEDDSEAEVADLDDLDAFVTED